MPQPVEKYGAVNDAGKWLTKPADGESAAEQVFATWGEYEPHRQEDEGDMQRALDYWLRQHPEVDPATVRVAEVEVEHIDDAPQTEAEPEPEPQSEPEPEPEPQPQPEPERPDTTAVLWLTDANLNRLTEIEDGATLDAPEGGTFNLELVPSNPVDRVEFDTTAGPRVERVAPYHAFGSNKAEAAEGEREVVARLYSGGTETTLRRRFSF